MRVLILANGDPPSPELLDAERAACDLFIAADGAANRLAARGIEPDVVLGDFDSITVDARAELDSDFVLAYDQDASDLEKAVAFAVQSGATSVVVLGAGGGRFDHALVAVTLLVKYAPTLDIRVQDDMMQMRAVTGETTIRGAEEDIVSLVALAPVEGVTTEGLLWPLSNEMLEPGSRGVSNRMTGATARVTVRAGTLILCHLRADAIDAGHHPSV